MSDAEESKKSEEETAGPLATDKEAEKQEAACGKAAISPERQSECRPAMMSSEELKAYAAGLKAQLAGLKTQLSELDAKWREMDVKREEMTARLCGKMDKISLIFARMGDVNGTVEQMMADMIERRDNLQELLAEMEESKLEAKDLVRETEVLRMLQANCAANIADFTAEIAGNREWMHDVLKQEEEEACGDDDDSG